MLLFCSRFYLLWKRQLIYCFLADSSVSYGKKNKTKKNLTVIVLNSSSDSVPGKR